jgi:hypothetical protein
MRRCVVLVTLVLSFVVPLAIPVAQAASPDSVQVSTSRTTCKRRRAKKPRSGEKAKKKGKNKQKPYGFEL